MNIKNKENLTKRYELARELYMRWGVDTEKVLELLSKVSISMHCWQGDDVSGFENPDVALSGGIQVTGNYPGKARTTEELRQDIKMAYSLTPGKHRLNLHAIYAETGEEKVERNCLRPEHFKKWVQWAKKSLLFNKRSTVLIRYCAPFFPCIIKGLL